MAEIIKKPRGTQDFLFGDKAVYDYVVHTLVEEFKKYNIKFLEIPTFEETKLFIRGVGESTDIVNKEIFQLENKGEHDWALRPEFTAGILRAVIENKLSFTPDLPLKIGYFGSVYRYERPQKGRFRELHQGGIEFFDQKIELATILEVLACFYFTAKKVTNRKLVLKINTLGSDETRCKWREALKEFYSPKIDNMCNDCKRRFEQNPLRILDCKVESDIEINKDAPKISSFLDDCDICEFEGVKKYLTTLNIPFEVDTSLVRGLDYYNGVVFELFTSDGDENYALGGGGKYSSLMKSLGGPDMEGLGFSFGLDRLMLSINDNLRSQIVSKSNSNDIQIYSFLENEDYFQSLEISQQLRQKGFKVTLTKQTKALGAALKQANRENARFLLILNQGNSCELKDLKNREQIKINSYNVEEITFYIKKMEEKTC